MGLFRKISIYGDHVFSQAYRRIINVAKRPS